MPSVSHTSRSQRVYNETSLALPTLPSAPQPARSKSRSRLRSLSNVSKKLIAKFRAAEKHEPAPPLPAPQPEPTAPPPKYSEHPQTQLSAIHSRSSSSSTSSRPPLRQRCNFQLTVATSKAEMKEKRDFTLDLNDQLKTLAALRSKGPRFSLLSPVRVSLEPTSNTGLDDVHEILPYLSVGFCDSRDGVPFKRFSHVVKIIYLGDEDLVDPSGRVWRQGHAHHAIDRENNCQVLTIAVPRPESGHQLARGRTAKRRNGNADKATRLTAEQLIYARDFLSLALPYYAEAHPEVVFARGMEEDESTRSADRVRVLICSPKECCIDDDSGYESDSSSFMKESLVVDDVEASVADIVSIFSCYLAYATDMPPVDMLKHFNDDPSAPGVWKAAVQDFASAQFVSEVVGKESVSFPCRG